MLLRHFILQKYSDHSFKAHMAMRAFHEEAKNKPRCVISTFVRIILDCKGDNAPVRKILKFTESHALSDFER